MGVWGSRAWASAAAETVMDAGLPGVPSAAVHPQQEPLQLLAVSISAPANEMDVFTGEGGVSVLHRLSVLRDSVWMD